MKIASLAADHISGAVGSNSGKRYFPGKLITLVTGIVSVFNQLSMVVGDF